MRGTNRNFPAWNEKPNPDASELSDGRASRRPVTAGRADAHGPAVHMQRNGRLEKLRSMGDSLGIARRAPRQSKKVVNK